MLCGKLVLNKKIHLFNLRTLIVNLNLKLHFNNQFTYFLKNSVIIKLIHFFETCHELLFLLDVGVEKLSDIHFELLFNV